MVRLIILLLSLLLGRLSAQAQEQLQDVADITVQINNFKNDKGKVMVALYDSESEFLKQPYQGAMGRIVGDSARITFRNIPKGIYAIAVFHDEDDNNKLNMFMGVIPAEPTACSNNAPAHSGPPDWKDALFQVAGKDVLQKIVFKY